MPGHIRRNRTQVAGWLDNADLEELRAIAEAQGRPISEVLRFAAKLYLRGRQLFVLQYPEGRAALEARGDDPEAVTAMLEESVAALRHFAYTPLVIREAEDAYSLH
jgi:hypothetical protein